MNAEFFKALDLLEKEKGIPKEYMIEKVEAALLSGFKKDNGYSNAVSYTHLLVGISGETLQIK